jgi:hypothetical protein
LNWVCQVRSSVCKRCFLFCSCKRILDLVLFTWTEQLQCAWKTHVSYEARSLSLTMMSYGMNTCCSLWQMTALLF